MKQQCHISMIYLSWALYVGGLAASAWYSYWALGAVWLVTAPIIQWLYICRFQSLSASMGYGRITDEPARTVAPAPVKVTLYTALGCPYCRLLERRIESLQRTSGIALSPLHTPACAGPALHPDAPRIRRTRTSSHQLGQGDRNPSSRIGIARDRDPTGSSRSPASQTWVSWN